MAAVALGLALAASPVSAVAAAAVATGSAVALLGTPRLGAVVAVLLALGAAGGHLRLSALDAPAGRIRDGAPVALRAELVTPPRPGRFGSSAEADVSSGRLRGTRLLIRAPAWGPFPRGVRAGEELALSGRLGALAAEGRSDFDDHLRRRGVAGELALERVSATGRRRGGLAGVLDGMRRRAERAVAAGLAPSDAALLRGMVLGQDEGIDPVTREDFRASGLAHLLAVSGQNVVLLVALALPLLLLAGVAPRGRLLVLAGLIAIYVPLAGAGPPLQRAGVMGLAGLAAVGASRPASRWYALLLAAVVTLAWNPRSAGDVGWQLSFAAVVGILLVGVPLGAVLTRAGMELMPDRSRRMVRVLADGVAISVAATLATAPLLAHHFGTVPLAGLPANLLALPAVAPAMWLGMVKAALGQLGLPGVAVPAAPAAAALGYLRWLAERFADLPAGQLSLTLGSPAQVLGAYLAIAAAAYGLSLVARCVPGDHHEVAARWRRLSRSRRVAVTLALVLLFAGATAAALERPRPPDRLTIRFLDVGQGDATLIQYPDGTAVLFDAGPPEAGVARLLRRAGVRRLDAVVATHASRDHHGGLLDVLRRFEVGLLLDGGDGTADPAFRAVLREAASRHIRRVPATPPLRVSLAGGRLLIDVLSPPPRPPGPPPDDPNPRGVVAIVSSGGFRLLLSADAESEALLPLRLPDVDAMKLPHHGSSDPGLPEVLARLRPELAAIEVGLNTYGHPAPSTLAALRRARVPTYRTDRQGTVTLTVDEAGLRVGTEH